eukprot:TRINITY_DN5681_c0_g2_i3.p1 TRINITY_DN5681_c0_g2~~TRINITY_DN5681_c0_g2_i3.p1  ORF type:complete len:622 (+),score=117.01 TRINITY_DN5681_c0_g2_i3:102-1967(+)
MYNLKTTTQASPCFLLKDHKRSCRVFPDTIKQRSLIVDTEQLNAPSASQVTLRAEDYYVEPGVLSGINRDNGVDDSAYMCNGCTKEECQGPQGCANTLWRNSIQGYLKEILMANVYDVAVETPLEEAPKLSDELQNKIYLKREDLQPCFSFKLRGAYNKMAHLTPEQLSKGVICSSAGNHAQGVALSASKLGCKSVICMPVNTPEIKVEAVKRYGGNVQLVGDTYSDTQDYAQKRAKEEGLVFVAPYDDPYTIAGQGTIANEIMRQYKRQLTNHQEIHAIFVAIGGGGLIAGIAAYVKALRPHVKVIGVEPTGANAMAMSLAKGSRIVLDSVDTFADGVAVKQVGQETFRLCQQLLDGVVLVDNARISSAIKDVFNETRSILEPAGALAVAGAKAYLQHNKVKDKTIVCVTSGANMNFDRLRVVADLADVGGLKEAILITTLKEEPGEFKKFVDCAVQGALQFTEFKYRYSAGANAHILFSVSLRQQEELDAMMERLQGCGISVDNITKNNAVQMHLRHLAGGRARSYTGEIQHEQIYQVDFPEKVGALQTFLGLVSPRWDITLFHYRKSGAIITKLLLGMRVLPCEEDELQAVFDELKQKDFSFSKIEGEAKRLFDMFIQ